MERCIDIRVEIKTLERLMEPEEAEVRLRDIPKHATRRGSNIFQIFDTKDEKKTILWQAEGAGWSTKERGQPCKKMIGMTLSIKE